MRKVYAILFLFCLPLLAAATHQVSGYITLKWLGKSTYQATLVDFTNTCNTEADRDTLRLYWGDGTSEVVVRSNGPIDGSGYHTGEPICNCRKINIYISSPHQYPGPGTYQIWFDDQDRMANIVNMCNSVNDDFFMFNTLTISPYVTTGVNAPTIQNNLCCVYACKGQCFYYNIGAYSPDGDSLTYSLGNCLSLPAPGVPAPCYQIPANATIDSKTGTIAWCNPTTNGIYNFSIRVITWKKAVLIGGSFYYPADTVEAELEIIVQDNCTDQNPKIVGPPDTCVVAGSSAALTFTATDPDGDMIDMTATGQPFFERPPAIFSTTAPAPFSVTGTVKWTTNCSEVRKQAYPVTITATDIGNLSSPPLNSYFTTNITVVGPAPPFLHVTPVGNTDSLIWGRSPCPQAVGYNIYRHQGCVSLNLGPCVTGVPASTGYVYIGSTSSLTDTTFIDNNGGKGLAPGIYYSYVVTATYPLPDGSESYASKDTCVLISRNVPTITNASITTTAPAGGNIFVRWTKPDASALDTVKNPGPYKYYLKRAIGMISTKFVIIDSATSTYFATRNIDTTYRDTGNTRDNSFNYKVDMYAVGNQFMGSSPTASTIYLKAVAGQNEVKLNWSSNVPWNDSLYYIYRKSTAGFSLLKAVAGTIHSYVDSGLTNGDTFCYYIESNSYYNDIHIMRPLYDSSEVQCATPKDTTAPCSPKLSVTAMCTQFRDSLIWTDPDHSCKNTNDVLYYNIYYIPTEQSDNLQVIAKITNPLDTVYVHDSLGSVAGCYAVTAVDSAGNESKPNLICVDNCPQYQLPNVFTPNGDGNNDLFTPILPYRYVKNININIYNRWGQLMFHTTDPNINWNGKVNNTGGECPDGVYYYICTVNEIRVTGIQTELLKGYVQIIRK